MKISIAEYKLTVEETVVYKRHHLLKNNAQETASELGRSEYTSSVKIMLQEVKAAILEKR